MNVYHNISKFTIHRDTRTLTTEMSTLDEGGRRPAFEQVYNDAIDEGFTIVGKKHEVCFVVCMVEQDGNGVIQYWELKPAGTGDEHKANGYRVVVFNT